VEHPGQHWRSKDKNYIWCNWPYIDIYRIHRAIKYVNIDNVTNRIPGGDREVGGGAGRGANLYLE